MFPLSIASKVRVFSKDIAYFEKSLNERIQLEFSNEESLEYVQTETGSIVKGALGRFAWKGFHFLNGISTAQIEVDKISPEFGVKYKLYFNESFYLALLFSIIPIFTSPNFKWHIKTEEYSVQILLFVAIWIVLYLGNMLVSLLRFQSFLKKAIKEILDNERNFVLEKEIERVKMLRAELEKSLLTT